MAFTLCCQKCGAQASLEMLDTTIVIDGLWNPQNSNEMTILVDDEAGFGIIGFACDCGNKIADEIEGDEVVSMQEWVVLRNGSVWYDRLYDEQQCIEVINMSVSERKGECIEDYTYRVMTDEEMEDYE